MRVWKVETADGKDKSTWDAYIVLAETFEEAVEKAKKKMKEEQCSDSEVLKSCTLLEDVTIE